MLECKGDGYKKVSPYAERYTLSSLFLTQIIQSGNYCYSSIRVASIDEVKITPDRLP